MLWEWGFEEGGRDEELLGAVLGLLRGGDEDEDEDEDEDLGGGVGKGKSAGRKRCGRKRFGWGNWSGERKRMGWETQRSWEVRG
jgi:hypothetical protein